jgi:hypothetical protein
MANPADFTIPAGQSLRKVRDFAAKYRQGQSLTREAVQEFFGDDITTALVRQKIIRRKRDDKDRELFVVTKHGDRLSAVRLAPRINRAKADIIVAGLLARARAINADPDLLYYVDRLIAFGSYARGENDLGDIDVMYDLGSKYHEVKAKGISWQEANLHRVAVAERVQQWDDRESFGRLEVLLLLKNRSRYITLHSIVLHEKSITGPKNVLYERPG